MAENLVKASVPEDEILTVMNSKQLQQTNLALNKMQQFNICALSAEEQKILQSLNHLNERLYCKYGRTLFVYRKFCILFLDNFYLKFNLKIENENAKCVQIITYLNQVYNNLKFIWMYILFQVYYIHIIYNDTSFTGRLNCLLAKCEYTSISAMWQASYLYLPSI